MLEYLSKIHGSALAFWQQIRRSPKFLPLMIVLATVVLIIVFKLVQPEPPVKLQAEKTWSVQTTQLVAGEQAPQLELYGQVESPYTATLTTGINADVRSLDVQEGQYVTAGQPLITLDDADVKTVYQQRFASVAELEALIESEKNRYQNDLASLKLEKSLVALAETKLAREEKTSKTNLTSQSSFDTQKQALENQKLALNARQLSVTDHPARLAQLEARLEQSRALLQQAQNDLDRAVVLAPFDGIILKTIVSPGERVRPGEGLLEIYATGHVELRAQLPQKYIAIVKQSLAEQIPMPARANTSSGEISVSLSRVSGAIAGNGVGVDALFVVDSEDVKTLTIGDNLKMNLTLPAIDGAFSIPVSSIYGTNRIYRVVDERLDAVNVDILGNQYHDGRQFVLVRSEKLQAGDEVITTQLPRALSGLKVEIRNTTAVDDNLSTLHLPQPAADLAMDELP
jgi:multidrug efflux pump subunit AcrA (membrane-fusion protein)